MQLPATVARACHGVFEAANVGTTSYASLTIANTSLLSAFGTPEQKRRCLRPHPEASARVKPIAAALLA